MRALSFYKKEILEIIKTPKLFILPAVFLFFGLTSPLTARYINEIVKALGGGMEIKLPDPTYIDSYMQFFKNMNSICIIVLILVLMGSVVDEKVKGSAILVLTKGVSRTQFILSKFSANVILFTFAYVLSAVSFVYYTYVLFPDWDTTHLFLSLAMFWIYGLLIISITLLASTVSKSHALAAVLGFIGYAVISASTVIPFLKKYSPQALNDIAMQVLTGSNNSGAVLIPVIITVFLTIITLTGTIALFNKQEI